MAPDKAIAGGTRLRKNGDRGATNERQGSTDAPLIAFAGALGALAVVRWAYRTALRVNRELEEARLARVAEAAAEPTDIPTLRRDPNTGAYRPG